MPVRFTRRNQPWDDRGRRSNFNHANPEIQPVRQTSHTRFWGAVRALENARDQRTTPPRKLSVANQCQSRLTASTRVREPEENGVTINYQFGAVDARGALIRLRAAPSEAALQAVIRVVPPDACDRLRAAAPIACQAVITAVGTQLPGDPPADRHTHGPVTFRGSAEMHLMNPARAMALPRAGMRFRAPQNIRFINFLKPI